MNKKITSFEYQHSDNLGDEIQTIAAIRVLKKLNLTLDDDFVNRKEINTNKPINLLVNGFFDVMELPNLLKENVTPIFSNIHINSKGIEVDSDLIRAFKKHEPIGCRDKVTTKLFRDNGVDAFFNYCTTLTLDKRDANIQGDRVFIVDFNLTRFFPLPKFLKQEKIEYLTHFSDNTDSHQTKMLAAEGLLEKYRTQAKLVITSRLHCALPCLAMGIPVILFSDRHNKRMQLAQEFIPIYPHPYFPYILKEKRWKFIPVRIGIMIQKVYRYIKYRYYSKIKVDWWPKAQNIEKIKQSILANIENLTKEIR